MSNKGCIVTVITLTNKVHRIDRSVDLVARYGYVRPLFATCRMRLNVLFNEMSVEFSGALIPLKYYL